MNLDELKLILVPTDFSEPSALALRVAIRLAQAFGAAIEVFHVDIDAAFVMPVPADLLSLPTGGTTVAAVRAQRLDVEAELVRRAGVRCTTASEAGRTHTEIVEHARALGAGLIVMGTHGRHGISHALLGSVAEKVVQHAACPVLVIPLAGSPSAAGSPPAPPRAL